MLKQKDHGNLVWLDMEMTGLDINIDVILEIAVIITDKELNILAKSPSYAIYQSENTLSKMDKWNQTTHKKSGLIERVKQSKLTVAQVEKDILKLLKKHVHKKTAPLCGNSIHQDRKFLTKFMPTLEDFFHYRNLDVSTLKELAKRWYPEAATGFVKHNKHEALADVEESIAELHYYREQIFVPKARTNNSNDSKE